MQPTRAPHRRPARAVARRAAAPQLAGMAGVLGTVVLLMLAWGALVATGLGLH